MAARWALVVVRRVPSARLVHRLSDAELGNRAVLALPWPTSDFLFHAQQQLISDRRQEIQFWPRRRLEPKVPKTVLHRFLSQEFNDVEEVEVDMEPQSLTLLK
jgi:hypothetical protein